MWYCAQLAFNMSLQRTSVTSNTILSSTSALFTFLFAVALLSEAFTLWKLGFILLLTVGEPRLRREVGSNGPIEGRSKCVQTCMQMQTRVGKRAWVGAAQGGCGGMPASRASGCIGQPSCCTAHAAEACIIFPSPSPPQAPPW